MRLVFAAVVLALALVSGGMASGPAPVIGAQGLPALTSQHNRNAGSSQYRLLAWSELGMHCIDGKDYSIFSVLPPYNIVRAQLIQMGEPPQQITSGVTITYEATADPSGSINTISSTKTNFWSYVQTLFLTSPPPDIGLTGNSVQNLTPHPLTYDSKNQYWTADGIPTVPYDDDGNRNPYGMAKIVARDSMGNVLATASIVLSVSDEITCSKCHASNSDPYAKPRAGWENDPDPAKDVKLNILKKHDDRFRVIYYLAYLKHMGYTYLPSLYTTAKSGTPVLCATCHSTNALGTLGFPGVRSMTSAMHTLHGPQINLDDGNTLDNETDPQKSCYLCHPGNQTKCQRGAMNKRTCQECHGNLSLVGQQNRRGWLDLPACQMCHTNSLRYTTTFDSPGHWRDSTDPTFATNKDKPVQGAQLYRYSSGHGKLYCSGCHGSPHAEFPTLQPNDNLYSQNLQGHVGKIAECNVCHTNLPVDVNNGPHSLHTVGQSWVDSHHDYIGKVGLAECAYCHGSDFRGSFLSKTSMARDFQTEDYGPKHYNSGDVVGCYDCHNGPGGGG
jgi:hypothetical protein